MFSRYYLAVAAVFLLLIAGCGKTPETEMRDAESAMMQAQNNQADQYVPEAYQMAMDTLTAAKAAAKEQDSKFALFRSYGKSKELFLSSKKLADKAAQDALDAKEQMKQEVATMQDETQVVIDMAAKAIATAPKGKGTQADIAMFKSDLESARTAFEQAKADINSGDYVSAKAKLTAVKTQAQGVVDQIESAKKKRMGR
jgi:hypothetical protein